MAQLTGYTSGEGQMCMWVVCVQKTYNTNSEYQYSRSIYWSFYKTVGVAQQNVHCPLYSLDDTVPEEGAYEQL